MWKLLIAEDETIIRRGLKNSLNWKEYSIDIVGEAEDGEIALEMAIELRPDIMFIDINMPFLNGIELMKRLRHELPHIIFIVITGYNEFSYAQQAIKMAALDFLLKPVRKEELETTVKTAVDLLQKKERNSNLYLQFKGNKQILKEQFLLNWCLGQYTEEEVKIQAQLLDINLRKSIGISIFEVIKDINISGSEQNWSELLLNFAVKNIIDDILLDYSNVEIFEDQGGHIVLLIQNIETETLLKLNRDIIKHLERVIGKVVACNETVLESSLDIPSAYKKLIKDMKSSQSLTPIVILAKNYIDQNYAEQSVSLKRVAYQVQVNPTYLSKQIKSDLGVSFVHYLTNVRINKALKLIKDPYLKIYEIAELVGYSSQHYFCNAFKKVVGISPTEFRNGVKKH
ncbi:hypothetical protein J14TS2_18690 [Bacillus sp. J14TS2]|uniref:response regulator transcription factor n=1 Tax=Bacillus sp. J14TS2 TaxID=2807188 RepID=UPI001B1CB2F8|nr:response regulator [Bacillus sp. J14TS2]GIN71394.1 hypothetical protein J14TS2_18690 [Bacillus sp. J14TS2]